MKLKRLALVAVLGGSLPLGACGSDVPTRAEFVAEIQKQTAEQLSGQLTGSGIDEDEADEIMSDFAGCVYDALAEDEDLLVEAMKAESGSPAEADIEKAAGGCRQDLIAATQAAAD